LKTKHDVPCRTLKVHFSITDFSPTCLLLLSDLDTENLYFKIEITFNFVHVKFLSYNHKIPHHYQVCNCQRTVMINYNTQCFTFLVLCYGQKESKNTVYHLRCSHFLESVFKTTERIYLNKGNLLLKQ
jgi:hypothetical protein